MTIQEKWLFGCFWHNFVSTCEADLEVKAHNHKLSEAEKHLDLSQYIVYFQKDKAILKL